MDQTFFGYVVPEWSHGPILFAGAIIFLLIRILGKVLTRTGLNPDGTPTEATHFGGPLGAMFMPVFLPSICYFLYFGCNSINVVTLNPLSPDFFVFDSRLFPNGLVQAIIDSWDINVFCVFSAWVLIQWVLYLIVPGRIALGTPLKTKAGQRLEYKINAVACHILTLVGLVGLVYFGYLPASYAYDNFFKLLTSAVVFTFALSILLYLHSVCTIRRNTDIAETYPLMQLSHTGNSGNIFYDFWMGRTLNPRLGFIDLKYVNELRPGLILWSVFNYSFAAKQYELTGTISPSMILVCIFHFIYVMDSHISEQCILTTMDITTDGFGFMLCFGDLAWVPFNYSLQARYLVDYEPHLSWYVLVGIVLLNITGFWIFRASNSQKNAFRTNPEAPEVAHLKFILTSTGRKLMCSGWWGISRHINYFGDLLLGLSWCLVTGFDSFITYFYIVYFTALLVDRQIRDDEACHKKYGKDWEKYCEMVPYRIIPGIY